MSEDGVTAPPAEEPAAAEVAPKAEAARSESEAGAKQADPGKRPKARKVTAQVLRAAARSPADVKDIVAAEARSKERRKTDKSSVFALAHEMQSGMGKIEDDTPSAPPTQTPSGTGKAATGKVKTASGKARATGKASSKARATGKQSSGSTTTARRVATPPTNVAPPPRPAAPLPASPRPAPSANTPARSSAPAPPSASRSPSSASRSPSSASRSPSSAPLTPPSGPPPASSGSSWPVALAVLVSGVAVAASLQRPPAPIAPVGEPVVGVEPVAPEPAPTAQVAAPADRAPSGSLADIGDGRVVYAAPTGELIVLRRDPTSAELEVERVYALVNDPQRHLGDPLRRFHGFYLDDLEGQRRDRVDDAFARYEAAVINTERTYKDMEQAEAAAVDLVAVGGADRLIPFLHTDNTATRRRTATLGLAENGYLCAVEPLVGMLEDHRSNPRFFARLVGLGAELTGEALDPSQPEVVILTLREWVKANPLADRFARR